MKKPSFKLLISAIVLLLALSFSKCEAKEGNYFVSISPAMTEIMYAINAESSLLAVSNYCNYPKEAKNKEKIGSGYSINEEKILKLRPKYILALDSSEFLLNKFKRFNITPLCFKYPNIDAVYQNILTVGKLANKEENAKTTVKFLKEKISKANAGKDKKILYLVQSEPMITIGKKSFITDIIEKSGNYSVTSNLNLYYPSVSEEYLIAQNPDVIVLGAFCTETRVKKLFPHTKTVKMTPYENDIINRPGPRIYLGVEYFSKL